ncbi:uncharacterized protein LOC129760209 [Uranotaenia lowii]|uniref:uncharacterized protein LOC129760209 n=1 Tax=Uranotaenia lowii TaxID=190385 RepID=UPI00247A4CD5|nr:uncharacterized protein LOC129760209 [Uranotaenia lowii]
MEVPKETILKYAAGNQEDNFCRLCFMKSFKLRNVFPFGCDPDGELYRKIRDLALIQLDFATEPNCCVCFRCITRLEEFRQFQNQCDANNNALFEALGKSTRLVAQEKQPEEKKTTVLIKTTPGLLKTPKVLLQKINDIDPFKDSEPVTPKTPTKAEENTRRSKRQSALQHKFIKTTQEQSGEIVDRSHIIEQIKIEPVYAASSDEESELFANEITSSSESEPEFKRKRKVFRSTKSKTPTDSGVPPKKRTSRSRLNVSAETDLDESCEQTGSSTEYRLYNCGHGGVNVSFRGNRYLKFRMHKKADDQPRIYWRCIEENCRAQVYTENANWGTVYWQEKTNKHNHSTDIDVDGMVDALVNSQDQDGLQNAEDEKLEVLASGKKYYKYSILKLPNGDDIFVYGGHRHLLLTEKANGMKLYGCTVKTCRAVIYYRNVNDWNIYSGSGNMAKEPVTYRKCHKIMSFENHYYYYSGNRFKYQKAALQWYCYLRKSHKCKASITTTEQEVVLSNNNQMRKRPHNHSKDAYNLDEMQNIIIGQEAIPPIESSEYHVAKNVYGFDFIIFEGLRYTIASSRTNGIKFCRCVEAVECKSTIFLHPNGVIVKYMSDNDHSHQLPTEPLDIGASDYVLQTPAEERIGKMFWWHNGFKYRRQYGSDDNRVRYRCVERFEGCTASFTSDAFGNLLRDNTTIHNHRQPHDDKERLRAQFESEGTADYQLEKCPVDGWDVITYGEGRYCHFYNHRDGWRVWRCFAGPSCRSTLFQDPADGRVFNPEEFLHHHDDIRSGTRRATRKKEKERAAQRRAQEKNVFSDSAESEELHYDLE